MTALSSASAARSPAASAAPSRSAAAAWMAVRVRVRVGMRVRVGARVRVRIGTSDTARARVTIGPPPGSPPAFRGVAADYTLLTTGHLLYTWMAASVPRRGLPSPRRFGGSRGEMRGCATPVRIEARTLAGASLLAAWAVLVRGSSPVWHRARARARARARVRARVRVTLARCGLPPRASLPPTPPAVLALSRHDALLSRSWSGLGLGLGSGLGLGLGA
eukprot:scaffold63761_cov45-Phaeocystis_antarctica.AAC.1